MISKGILVYNCYNLGGNNATLNVIIGVGSVKMFFPLPESNSGSADSLLHSNLIPFSISNYTNFYQIGIKAERSFKERVTTSFREENERVHY